MSAGGDYQLESGTSLRKKLLVRRLVTTLGTWRHAGTYGSSPGTKTPLSVADYPTFKAALDAACLQELDAVGVSSTVSGSSGAVTYRVSVTYRGGDSAAAGVSYGTAGEIAEVE